MITPGLDGHRTIIVLPSFPAAACSAMGRGVRPTAAYRAGGSGRRLQLLGYQFRYSAERCTGARKLCCAYLHWGLYGSLHTHPRRRAARAHHATQLSVRFSTHFIVRRVRLGCDLVVTHPWHCT